MNLDKPRRLNGVLLYAT